MADEENQLRSECIFTTTAMLICEAVNVSIEAGDQVAVAFNWRAPLWSSLSKAVRPL